MGQKRRTVMVAVPTRASVRARSMGQKTPDCDDHSPAKVPDPTYYLFLSMIASKLSESLAPTT